MLFEKSFANWPKMAMTKDGGVHVTGRYVSPALDKIGGIFIIPGAIAGGYWAWVSTEMIVVAALGTIAGGVAAALIAFRLFAKRLNLKVYANRIVLPGWIGPRKYSRDMPMEFRIEQHRRAMYEKGVNRTYRDALEVVMQYGEKRVPIAAMPQDRIELARALVIRLQNICDSIDMAKSMGGSSSGREMIADFGPAPHIR